MMQEYVHIAKEKEHMITFMHKVYICIMKYSYLNLNITEESKLIPQLIHKIDTRL